MRCYKCQGSGSIMGAGMVFRDCDCDDGEVCEAVERCAPSAASSIDKRSKAYKEAISNLMKSGDFSKAEAIKMFDSEYEKL